MRILLTGATGYIGQRLLPVLLEQGHEVYCCVRREAAFRPQQFGNSQLVKVLEVDLTIPESLANLPQNLDAAYYLVHSMGGSQDFEAVERQSAQNFVTAIAKTRARQIIYLSGIVNATSLSKHLLSRKGVEDILNSGPVPVTTLRAGIIVGSGSASFEIIRDLVEKLPVMVTPRWLSTKCQPIGIRNVVEFLSGVLLDSATFNQHFDIYGPDILTYKQMLLEFARIRGLKRHIYLLPVMTPKLSSYWLYFVTSTSYPLARSLVESMRVDVVAQPNHLAQRLGIKPMGYEKAIRLAFDKIEQNMVLSSWKNAGGSQYSRETVQKLLQVPRYGVFTDKKMRKTKNVFQAAAKVFAIGGSSGWYYGNWMWRFRGFLDKLFGGVGLNRGRRNAGFLEAGDTLDFWRVLFVDKQQQRLLLYAEMKMPGEAWLEFRIQKGKVFQTATFRPLGIAGRLYWYAMLPFHYFIFNGMIDRIANHDK